MSETKDVKKSFYQVVAENNEGVIEKNVKSIFVWYDLLSFSLAFELIIIATNLLGIDMMGINFSFTMFSVVCLIITDTLLKLSLTKDSKNYVKFNNQMSLVKLCTIPLMVLIASIMGALILMVNGVF